MRDYTFEIILSTQRAPASDAILGIDRHTGECER